MEFIKDIIENLQAGHLWSAWLLAFVPLIYSRIEKRIGNHPRLISLPLWYGLVLFVILIISLIIDIPYIKIWLIIAIATLIFTYVFLTRITIKFSYELLLLRMLTKRLANKEIVDYATFYNGCKKYFISELGKYNFALINLDYHSANGNFSLCFDVMDDIQKLKLTDSENRKVLIKQFNIYCQTQALRLWNDKYSSVKKFLSEEDQVFVDSILAYHRLDLNLFEEFSHRLLTISTNDSYRQVALNNSAVFAENSRQKIEWSNYAVKSFESSPKSEFNKVPVTLNLIDNLIHKENYDEAEKLFRGLVQSLPSSKLSQRVQISNIKLHYYRQRNDARQLTETISTMFDEYKSTVQSPNYSLLVSLLRISLNHQVLFEQVLSEVEGHIQDILKSNFSHVRMATHEIIAVSRSAFGVQNESRVFRLIDKCIERLNDIDVDLEISKLREEDVVTKRCYIKFKFEISMFNLNNPNFDTYKNKLFEKLEFIDELIIFDKKQGILTNLLESLFIKLDEITTAYNLIPNIFQIAAESTIRTKLYKEAELVIAEILPIIEKADKSSMMAEYHLQLAHHYCCLNRKIDGEGHFMKFKQSKVGLQHYASWLQQWYYRLDSYFGMNDSFS